MLESSESFDISRIKGAVLNQICVGLYQVILRFESNVSVSCSSSMHIRTGTKKEEIFPLHTGSGGILELLGDGVVDAEIDENETLSIMFKKGSTVHIAREGAGYESYELWIGKDFLIM